MILKLHTGPKSSPRLALFDTAGISILAAETPAFREEPDAPWDRKPDSRHPSGSKAPRPNPDGAYYRTHGADSYEEDLAEWTAELATVRAEWATERDAHNDARYRNAVVWHGCRYVCAGMEGTDDVSTDVHETPAEILAMLPPSDARAIGEGIAAGLWRGIHGFDPGMDGAKSARDMIREWITLAMRGGK